MNNVPMHKTVKMAWPACVYACALALSAGAVQAAELSPHRAAYAINLDQASEAVDLSAASGQIAYGLEKVCDGWLAAQNGTLNLHLPSGEVAEQAVQYSTWEAADGSQYRFTVKSEEADPQVILGTAQISPGAEGQVVFAQPQGEQFTLPVGTMFPVAHTAFMIDAARAGKNQIENYIFEGTDVEGAKLLVAFISPLSAQSKDIIKALGGDLLGRPGWNFRMAYFDPQDQSGEPLYEVGVDLLDNGVAPRWILDYGAYSVEMKLSKVEPMAKPDC